MYHEYVILSNTMNTVDNLIHAFVVTYGDTDTVQSVDWYILPIMNPDGYEFSHNYDRMWRKTRSKYTDSGESIISMALVSTEHPACLHILYQQHMSNFLFLCLHF